MAGECSISIDCEKVRVCDNTDYAFWELCNKASLIFTSTNFPLIYKRGLHGKTLPLSPESVNSTVLNIPEATDWSAEEVFEAHRAMLGGTFFTAGKIIVTTMGASPVLLTVVDNCGKYHQQEVAISAVESATIVDTTGAGDVFISGFLFAWYVSGVKDLAGCVRVAADVAASKLTSLGARGDSLVPKSQLLKVIASRGC